MGLLDRYVNTLTDDTMGPYAMTEEDRKKLKKRGLLQFGLNLLSTPTGQGGVFQAFGKAAAGAAQDVQQGGQDMMQSKFRADQMARQKAEFDKQKVLDTLGAKYKKPDGTLDIAGMQNEYYSLFPSEAFKAQGSNGELAMWNNLNQGLSQEEQLRARKIKLKLEGGESSAAIQYKPVVQPDGSVRYMAFDPNNPTAQVPTVGGVGQPAPTAPQQPAPFPPRMSDAEVNSQAFKMSQMGMPQEKVNEWVIAQKSTPDMVYEPVKNQPPSAGILPSGITPDEKVRREAEAAAAVKLRTEPLIVSATTTATQDAKNAADLKLEKDKKVVNAQNVLSLLGSAEETLNSATASGFGAMRDSAYGMFGASTEGADATAALDVIAGQLVLSQPRMEGPQSDADRLLYAKMAGNLADNTKPLSQRKAAFAKMKELAQKYVNRNGPNATAPSGGMSIEERAAKYRNK